MNPMDSALISRAQNALAMLGLSERETQRYSLFKALRAMKYGAMNLDTYKAAAFERECSDAVAKKLDREISSSWFVPSEVLVRPLDERAVARAMATTPGSKGGYLVPTQTLGFI